MRFETMMILGDRENLREFLKAVKEQRESSRHCFTALYPAQRVASIGHLIGPTSGHYQPQRRASAPRCVGSHHITTRFTTCFFFLSGTPAATLYTGDLPFLLDLVFLGYKPPVLVQRMYPYCAGGRADGIKMSANTVLPDSRVTKL